MSSRIEYSRGISFPRPRAFCMTERSPDDRIRERAVLADLEEATRVLIARVAGPSSGPMYELLTGALAAVDDARFDDARNALYEMRGLADQVRTIAVLPLATLHVTDAGMYRPIAPDPTRLPHWSTQPCIACGKALERQHPVALLALGPGGSVLERQLARHRTFYHAVALYLHYACVTSADEVELAS